MKRIRKYTSTALVVFVFVLLATSCESENPMDVLKQQQEQADKRAAEEAAVEAAEKDAEEAEAAANAAALEAAGVMTDYTVNLHVDTVPVEGVLVTITNQSGSTVSVTSDANGNATFVDIAIGGYNVAITSQNHLDASYIVDFGPIVKGVHYDQLTDGTIVPTPTSESSKIALFESNGTQTATIKGTVEIETDLTNSTPEVPQDITLRANLDAAINASHSNREGPFGEEGSIYVKGSFTFTQGDIGVATVDNTTGEYSMQVPANVEGTEIAMLFPLVETFQRVAYSQINGINVGPQARLQPTVFGEDIAASATPDIPAVIAEFDAVPPPGRGFTVGIERRARNSIIPVILVGLIDLPVEEDYLYVKFKGTPGSGYQISPTVTVTAPESIIDAEAVVHADMAWDFQSVNITDGGSGYMVGEQVSIYATMTLENGPVNVLLTSVNANAFGSVPTGEIELNLINHYISHQVFDVELTFLPIKGNSPVGTMIYSGKVEKFDITYGGFGFSTIPQYEISGGNPVEPATLEVTDMAFRHLGTIDNSSITQPYVLLPEIHYNYANVPGSKIAETKFLAALTNESGDVSTGQSIDPLEDHLRVTDNGLVFNLESLNVNFANTPEEVHPYFDIPSFIEPEVLIIEPEHEQTTAKVTIKDGKITGLEDIIIGKGYNTAYGLTLKTLDGLTNAGSNATIALTGFTEDPVTTEVTWGGGYTITNPGSGYSTEANIAAEPFIGPTAPFTIKNGETKIVNINYGTGRPVDDLE